MLPKQPPMWFPVESSHQPLPFPGPSNLFQLWFYQPFKPWPTRHMKTRILATGSPPTAAVLLFMPCGCWFLADLVLRSELGVSCLPWCQLSPLHLDLKFHPGSPDLPRGSELYLWCLATLWLYPPHVPLGRPFISLSNPALRALALTKCLWNGYSNTCKDIRIRKRLCLNLCAIFRPILCCIQYNLRGEAFLCSPFLFQYKVDLA